MNRFLEAIERSVEANNWYAAVALALTIPDICGWVEDPSKRSKQRYKEWFDKYILPKYKNNFFGPDFAFLTAGDCYSLRCSLLHEGVDEISRQNAREVLSRIIFITTGSHRLKFGNKILLLDVSSFCREVCEGVRSWLADLDDTQEIQDRMKELISIKTEPFMVQPGFKVS